MLQEHLIYFSSVAWCRNVRREWDRSVSHSDEDEVLGSDNDTQENPKDYCKGV